MYILIDCNGNILITAISLSALLIQWQSIIALLQTQNINSNIINETIIKWNVYDIRDGKNIQLYKLNNQLSLCKHNIDKLYINNKQNNSNTNNNIFINNTDDQILCKLNISSNNNVTNIIDSTCKGTETLIDRCISEHQKNIKINIDQEIANKKAELQMQKQKLQKEKEYWENFNKKYIIDRNLYFRLIEENKINEEDIPKLFLPQWKRFNHMKINNMLDLNIVKINQFNEDTNKIQIQTELKEYIKIAELYKESNISNPYHGLFDITNPFITKYDDSDINTESESE